MRATRGLFAASAFAVALPAFAQEPAPAAAPEEAASSGVEEIVITSTKREQNIQDVPIAVSAFTGEDLIARGVDEVEELEEISPSIQINTSNSASNGGTIRIRGMGTTGNNPGLESAVGSFIDGVYRSRAGQTFGDLLDIERVEILRGPQGTLFGKNTSAGAIHIITKKPVLDDMEGFVSAEIGNLDHKRVSISHSAPIVEGILGYRVSATWNDRDGYFKDIHNDNKYAERDRYALRGQLLWAPVEEFEARLIADYGERDESCCPAQTFYFGPTSNRLSGFGAQELAATLGLGRDFIDIPNATIPANATGCIGLPPGNGPIPPTECLGPYPFERASKQRLGQREVGVNYAPFENVVDWGAQLEMSYDLDFMTVTSITAYRDFHAQYGEDIDFTSADILRPQQGLDDTSDIWSQEIRLVGTAFDKLDWLVGGYFYWEDLGSDERLEFGSQAGLFISQNPLSGAAAGIPFPIAGFFPEGAGYEADWKQEADGYAFFTHNTFHITDSLSVTGGLRFSHETKRGVGLLNDAPFAVIGNQVQTGTYAIGSPVPLGTNDFVDVNTASPGGWCEDLSNTAFDIDGPGAAPAARYFAGVRSTLRGFCDNGSWRKKSSENEFTGQVSVSYAVTEDINVYTTYSRGYKAGGFNLDQESLDIITCGTAAGCVVGVNTYAVGTVIPTNLTSTGIVDEVRFKPEFANSYEIGIKGTYLDGRARINIAGFWTDFSDFQLNTFNGLGFIITNVDKVQSRGFELEMLLAPTDGVTVNFGVTYADTRYGDNIDLCFPLQYPDGSNNNCDANSATPNIPGSNDAGPQAPFAQDFFADGHRITNAPAWIGSLSIYGERQLVASEWMGYGSFGVRYTGRRNTGSNLHPLKFEPHHYFLQASVGVRSPDGHWDASVWSNNLNNEYENGIIFDSVFQGGNQGAYFNVPRTYGLTVKYNFGD